jgi:hypothetical protein
MVFFLNGQHLFLNAGHFQTLSSPGLVIKSMWATQEGIYF